MTCLPLALATFACNKRPAEEAIAAAQQALTAASDVESYEPEEFAAVSASLREARASYAGGRYTDALRVAQRLPDRIAAAAAAAAKRKARSAAAWRTLSADLPASLEALGARLSQLSSANAISSERLLSAQAELAALNQVWADATAAFEKSDVPGAVSAAHDAAARAGALATQLGLQSTPPGPAPAAAPGQER